MGRRKVYGELGELHARWFTQDGVTLFLDSLQAHAKRSVESFADSLLPYSVDDSEVKFTAEGIQFMKNTRIGALAYRYVESDDADSEKTLVLTGEAQDEVPLVLSAREGRAYEMRGKNLEAKLKALAIKTPDLSLYAAIEQLAKGKYSESRLLKQHVERLETLTLDDFEPAEIKSRADARTYKAFVGQIGDELIARYPDGVEETDEVKSAVQAYFDEPELHATYYQYYESDLAAYKKTLKQPDTNTELAKKGELIVKAVENIAKASDTKLKDLCELSDALVYCEKLTSTPECLETVKKLDDLATSMLESASPEKQTLAKALLVFAAVALIVAIVITVTALTGGAALLLPAASLSALQLAGCFTIGSAVLGAASYIMPDKKDERKELANKMKFFVQDLRGKGTTSEQNTADSPDRDEDDTAEVPHPHQQ
jgi:hypothetical protein